MKERGIQMHQSKEKHEDTTKALELLSAWLDAMEKTIMLLRAREARHPDTRYFTRRVPPAACPY